MMSRPDATIVNVALDGGPHEPGPPPVPPTAETNTAVVAEADMRKLLPNMSLTSGVRKRKGWWTVTVRVLPAPDPPGELEHVIVVPA